MKLNNRYYVRLLTIVAFLLLIGVKNLFAQSSRPTCPGVSVSSPDAVAAGEWITFTVNVSGGDPAVTPTYNWSISAGTIASGQGTSSITVETNNMEDGGTITATVDIGGYARECPSSNSSTTMVTKKSMAQKFDEYGTIKPNDENARLDVFSIELLNDPMATAYIISYGGRKSLLKAAQVTANRAKKYLVSVRGISADRIITVDGGYREELTTQLYVDPNGAPPPSASPTVDPSEIKPVKIKVPVKQPVPVKKVTTKTVTKVKGN